MHTDQKIKEIRTSDCFKVKQVKQRSEIDDFGLIIEEAFDKTPQVINKMFEKDSTLIHNDIIAYIIYKDEEPLSAVMTVLSKNIAGIYWVGICTKARGQGLGSLATKVATNIAFDKNINNVILQASALGEKVYKKLGYKTITRYRTYTIKNKRFI